MLCIQPVVSLALGTCIQTDDECAGDVQKVGRLPLRPRLLKEAAVSAAAAASASGLDSLNGLPFPSALASALAWTGNLRPAMC